MVNNITDEHNANENTAVAVESGQVADPAVTGASDSVVGKKAAPATNSRRYVGFNERYKSKPSKPGNKQDAYGDPPPPVEPSSSPTVFLSDPDVTLWHGDVRETLAQLEAGSVDCVVTSPPYWGLRNYSVDEQLGLEPTPDLYIENMVGVFREVWRVLADHGTCWVNMGDSYASGGSGRAEDGRQRTDGSDAGSADSSGKRLALGGRGLQGGGGRERSASSGRESARGFRPGSGRADGRVDERGQRNRDGTPPAPGLKPKDLVGVPWKLAFALQADGWYLRSDIVWSKPNPMPESVTDRPTKAHEYVFLLAKRPRYFFDQEAVREPNSPHTLVAYPNGPGGMYVKQSGELDNSGILGRSKMPHGGLAKWENGTGRNIRSVWEIATQPYPEAHFATFPEELARRCILAGCPEGGTVLDPFVGSGTVPHVARKHGRHSIGIDLNLSYLELAADRTKQLSLLSEVNL